MHCQYRQTQCLCLISELDDEHTAQIYSYVKFTLRFKFIFDSNFRIMYPLYMTVFTVNMRLTARYTKNFNFKYAEATL